MSRASRVRWILASVLALAAGVGAAVAVAAGLLADDDRPRRHEHHVRRLRLVGSKIWVQDPDPVGRSFAAPDTGVITQWSIGLYRVTDADPTVALKVVRPGGGPGVYAVVGTDAHTAGPITNTPQVLTFQTRIPVQAGDRLGGLHGLGGLARLELRPLDAGSGGPWTGDLRDRRRDRHARHDVHEHPDAPGRRDRAGRRRRRVRRPHPGRVPREGREAGRAVRGRHDDAPRRRPARRRPPRPAAPVAAAATCRVPRLKGVTRATAVKRLRAAGCRLGTVRLTKAARRATGPAKRRLVVVTAPKPGSRRPADSGVPLTLGPPKRR